MRSGGSLRLGGGRTPLENDRRGADAARGVVMATRARVEGQHQQLANELHQPGRADRKRGHRTQLSGTVSSNSRRQVLSDRGTSMTCTGTDSR